MTPPPHARPRLLFIVTEDWFFLSHFVGMGNAAIAAGFEVFVAARASEKRQAIEAQGIHVIDTGSAPVRWRFSALCLSCGRSSPMSAPTLCMPSRFTPF